MKENQTQIHTEEEVAQDIERTEIVNESVETEEITENNVALESLETNEAVTKEETTIEEPKEEIEEKIPEENTNQPDTNDGSNDKPVETPAGDGATTEVEKEPEYIKTPEEAQNFIMKLLNHIIDFIVRLFKK